MSHHKQDGSEKLITYPLRSLSPDEHQYSHMDKEALAIILTNTTPCQYLLDRRFDVLSDPKQLISLLASNKPILPMASAHIPKWLLLLRLQLIFIDGCYYPAPTTTLILTNLA